MSSSSSTASTSSFWSLRNLLLTASSATALIGASYYLSNTCVKRRTAKTLLGQAGLYFETHFGGRRPTHIASAPGRVNLVGEHTDYSEGFVFPMAINRRTFAVGAFNASDTYRLVSLDAERLPGGQPRLVELSAREFFDASSWQQDWHGYVRAVAAQLVKHGVQLPPFDLVVHGNVPIGGGLSSSAALEMAVCTLLEAMTGATLDKTAKALMCQAAEHDVGVPCGIMDQFTAAWGKKDQAMLVDCRSHVVRHVAMDDPDVVVLIVNSNVQHSLADGEYKKRRDECEHAVRALRLEYPYIKTLRDVTEAQLDAMQDMLSDLEYRRAKHVVTENARATQFAARLEAKDWVAVGELMAQSHASLRDNFEVTCEEVDFLVDTLQAAEGVVGARMTGGGFGGCVVALVKIEHLGEVQEAVVAAYAEQLGKTATCITSRASRGARVHDVPLAGWA